MNERHEVGTAEISWGAVPALAEDLKEKIGEACMAGIQSQEPAQNQCYSQGVVTGVNAIAVIAAIIKVV